ncbi:aldo/keto reductase [Agromyces neolithicus]|uniref:aldo/keto reductase n=1 Tax=Agromyces neolithicus TaxID=269420 RepID=UPI0031D0DE6D
MARRHSMAHGASVAEATYAERARAAALHQPAEDLATTTSVTVEQRVETITSNPLSGPITVPRRAEIGETGLSAHPIALGSSTFGWTVDDAAASDVLDRYAGTGGSIIDTSDSFSAGRSERIIGRWMSSRGTRDRMIVTTRVGRHPDRRARNVADLVAAVDDSLGRLGTDRIDLLYLQDEHLDIPLEERLGAVDALITAGKVRAIGASDFSPERLIEARVLAANGLPRFEALTTRYSLLERQPFEGAPELVAHAQGLSVLPYFALANGFLGGGVRRRSDARHDARGARQAAHLSRRGHRVLEAIDAVAFAHGVAPATIALAWLLAKPTVAAPVVSATRPEHVEALMSAACVELARSELVELDRASA